MKTRRGFFRVVAGLVAVATTGLAGCLRQSKTVTLIPDSVAGPEDPVYLIDWPKSQQKYQPVVTIQQVGPDGQFMDTAHVFERLTIEDFQKVIRRMRERELELLRTMPRTGPNYADLYRKAVS